MTTSTYHLRPMHLRAEAYLLQFAVCFGALTATAPIAAQTTEYDVVIRNGRVLDGAGNPWIRADVAFAAPAAVCVGCVEHRDADVRGPVHEREGRVGVLPHLKETWIRPNPAEVAAAQNEPGDFEAGLTKRAIFHAVFS